MDATLKSEVLFNTTDGSSGRPVMRGEPSESSAKSVLTEVTRSNERVLRGSIIAKEEMDATPKSEVLFNTTDGSSGRPVMSGEPSESSAKSVLTEVTRSNKRVLRGSIIAKEEMDATPKSEVLFNTTDGSSGRPVMSGEPSESSAKSVLTEVTRSNKRVLRGSIIAKEEMDATPKSEVLFNTTDGSSGRPVMSGEPSESSAKSVLTEVTRSNKRVLRGSIIGDEEMDATLKSEVVFNTTDGNPSGLRETSLTVPSASKKSKNSESGCYTLMEVMEMTDNFGKRIEEYGFGTVYHGKLRTGQEVAVKVWAERSHSAAEEFHEFEIVCGKYEKCSEHIVKVIGYCEEGDQQISIYEYMPHGTLRQHLHDKGFLDSKTHALDWKTRLQIALHMAQGVQYLGIQYAILWEDTIFLTKNWVPKSILSGQPYAIPVLEFEKPWYPIANFGHILRELISRQPRPKYGKRINHWVKIVSEDFGNMGISNPTLGSNFPKEAIEKIAKLIHMCLQTYRGQPRVFQLTMSDVIDEINGALQLEEGKKQQQPETSNVQSRGSSKPGLYTSMEVLVITNNFAKKIGENHSGTMYHGKLQTGQKVVVKVWELKSHSAAEEFDQFGKICYNSENLCQRIVQMIGYYESETHQISIYQYMPGGTLQHRLFGPLDSKTRALDWKARLKIALHIAQGLPHFPEQYFKLESKDIFLTQNGVPKVTIQPWPFHRENSLVYEFGRLLWELISGQQQCQPREGLSLVEDFRNEGFIVIDPTLGSNFREESMMKTIRIAHSCMQPMGAPPIMDDLINLIREMNDALRLEKGQNVEEGGMNIEIPQHASQSKTCASLETTLEEIKKQTIFDEKSISDCDPKGKRQQQPQTSTTQSHGSRSSEGDSMCSISDDEMPSTSKNQSLSPQLEMRATTTSIEGVPNLPTTSSSSTMYARRKNNEGNVELLFENAENMSQVVGVGLEWAKVVITKKLDVEVRHIGEHAWQDLWPNLKMAGQVYGDFELMDISLPELQTQDQRPSNILLEDLTERFGVGLSSSDVISVYREDQVGQSIDEGFAPLVLKLAEYMGVEEANVTKRRPVSGGEGESSKGAAGGGSSKEASTGTQDPPQDPPGDPPQDPAWNPPDDQDQDPPNDPAEDPPDDPPDDPAEDPPEPLENKKVHVVTIYPEYGYVRQGSPVPQENNHPIYEACIVPILRFEFELRGNHKKITTTLRTQCNLGEGGGLNGTPSNLGYFQDNITISLTCEKERAATLSSSKVEDVQVVKRTITNNNSTSLAREGSGQLAVSVLGLQVGGRYGGTTETGYSTAREMEIEWLGGGFCVHPRQLANSLAYNFSYPKEMKDIIADHHHGRTELLDFKIGDTVWPTIIGEWDALDMSRKCKYNFKTRRDITSIKGLRQSHGNGEELQSITQQYVVPLWVNHAMTHILHRDDIIQAPGRVRKVIGAKTALHGPRT
ncbi:unnamed protein product [Sphagnum compactum]